MDDLENYYRVHISIDLDAVYKNIINLKRNIKEDTGIIAVIKTDGYGHGAVPIAYTINEVVSAFAVATIDEAVNLREHNILKPIYVIGYTHKSQYSRAIENQVRMTIFSLEDAVEFNNVAKNMNKIGYIHLKLDTGMSRIGFMDNQESIEIIKKISQLENIKIEGIFTHFASSDELDKSKAKAQLNRFTSFIQKLEKEDINIEIKHCSNSAAMMEMPDANMDCVRAGIAMYGLYPSEEVDKNSVELIPALGMKSHIVHLKKVEVNTPISYGGTFVTEKRTMVATIPVGYGDGYRRSLSNRGYVLINGCKARILGRVCMDQFMVDVTNIPSVKVGDEVVLIGKSGNETITVEMLADMATETFNYEIVCDLGKRIPRVYYRNGKVVCMKDYFSDKYNVKL